MNNNNNNIKHWSTDSTYVDIETAEVISKQQVTNGEYTVINKQQKYIINEQRQSGIRCITNECKKTNQRRLFN